MDIGSTVMGILALYFVVMAVMGMRGRKYTRTFRSRVTAGGQVSLALLVGGAIGGQVGSGFVVGGAEYGATYGIGGAWYGIACGLSYLVVSLIFTKFAYRRHLLSVADYFKSRYSGRGVRLICSSAMVFASVAALASQLLAGRAVFYSAGLDGFWGVVATSGVSLLYATLSGFWGALAAGFMQTAVIGAGICGSLFVLWESHGTAPLDLLPATAFSMTAPFARETLIRITVPNILSSITGQSQFQRIASARDERTAILGHGLAGVALLPLAFVPALIGMYGRALHPSVPADGLFAAVAGSDLPPALGACILAAVICAVLASCNSILIGISTNIIHDIMIGVVWPGITERWCTILTVIINFCSCAAGISLAFALDDIIEILALASSVSISCCLVPYVGGIIWRRGNNAGAISAAVAGLAALAATRMTSVEIPFRAIAPIVPSAVAYICGSLLSKSSHQI